MSSGLLVVLILHVLWTAALYMVLTVVRAPAVWGLGVNTDGSNPWAGIEPRVSANLSNQFEWPLFFHGVCIIVLCNPELYNRVYIWLGCVFIVGRIIHSAVQILTVDIRLRGLVFTVNFVAVLAMWCVLGYSVLQ